MPQAGQLRFYRTAILISAVGIGCAAALGARGEVPSTRPTTAPARVDLATLLSQARRPSIGPDDSLGGLCKHPDFAVIIRERDRRMERLREVLALIPSEIRIECLALDTFYDLSPAPQSTSNSVLLHRMEPVTLAYERELSKVGSLGLTATQWEFIGPQVRKLATLQQPKAGVTRSSRGPDVVVVCYYDGKTWNSRVWQNMAHLLLIRSDQTGVQEFGEVITMIDWYHCLLVGPGLRDLRYDHLSKRDVIEDFKSYSGEQGRRSE